MAGDRESGKERSRHRWSIPRRRSLALEIKTDGQVIIRAPEGISEGVLMEFVRTRQEWILKKWFDSETKRRNLAQVFPHDYEEDPKLEAAYRRKARERIGQRTAYFAALMGVTYGRISIRSAKTRWGSCSSKGNLNSLEAGADAAGGSGLCGGS